MLYTNNQENNSSQAHIQLLTRVRPLHAVDHVLPTPYFHVDPARGNIILGGKQLFQFDYVLPFHCPQEILYKGYVESPINACFEGYNISIIAYGQTGSGKSYTVFGPGLLFAMNEADFGLVPRAVRHIFYKKKEYPERTFSIQASYLEIYDGEIQDLLSSEPFHGEITIQEDANGETIVSGATKMECQTIDDVFSCLETGLSLRHTGPMMLNQLSSRSHGIFTIYIQQAWTQDGCLYEVRSKLHFVDLAGSERLSGLHTEGGANSATAFTEPSPINSGLLALSSVTAALGDPRRKASHIPYWDSKLTCILKDSLGGNAFTLLIVCLSPSASDLEETMNTLKFASTAANICNRPVSNVRMTPMPNIATNPVINQQQFIPIRTPAHLYPSLPYGTYPSQSNVSQANHQNLNALNNDNANKKEDATEDSQMEDELFKLRFAASQWQQLVSNAESLLNELVAKGSLAGDTQNRIRSWLCLKEEYQHCIDPELYAMKPRIKNQTDPNGNHSINAQHSVLGLPRTTDSKTLHVIEEVSEPTPTHDTSSSISDEAESLTNSSSSDSSHFEEQLDLLRRRFRETTDLLISSIETGYDSVLVQEWTKLNPVTLESAASLRETSASESPFKNPVASSRRRVSIFTAVNQDLLAATSSSSHSSSSHSASVECQAKNDEAAVDSEGEECEHDIRQEMRRLSETSESRRLQVFQTNKQLKEAQETLKDLRKAIKLKEEFITDLAEAGRESELSKQKFGEKIERLEHDAAQTRSDLAEAQIRLRDLEDQSLHRNKHGDSKNDVAGAESDAEAHCERIQRHQREISRYENRLMDMAKLLDLTGRSPRKVDELERSLTTMKEQQSHLKEQLRLESERKKELKLELENDHVRIVELERQLKEKRRNRRKSLDPLTSNGDQDTGESELEHKWRWLVAEEERLVEMRTAIQWQSEALEEKQSVLDKREMALDKSHQSEADRQLNTSNSELGARRKKDPTGEDKMIQTSTDETVGGEKQQLAVSLKEACADKETTRKEIRKLRHTRDSLVQQRQELDERQHRGRELDSAEERRLLELDEAIEAVDAAIEYKNEIICSRTRELKSPTETGLLTRLMSLTHVETRSLLCKYFHKVIDLREGSKKIEQQFAELESQFEDQSRYVWKLSSALKHTQLEVERRSTNHQRNYEQKTSHFSSGQSPSSAGRNAEGSSSAQRKLRQLDDDYNQQRDNRDLRKHLRELLSVTPKHRTNDGGTTTVDGAASVCSSRTPSLSGLHAVQALHDKIQGLQRLKGRQSSPATTTTVTREKNKLIIKQQPVESKQTKRRSQR